MASTDSYPVRLTVDYPEELNRLTTFFRPIMIIPILVIFILITGSGGTDYSHHSGRVADAGMDVSAGLFLATLLMILFRQRYPRWWFDFVRELARFGGRLACYLFLLTDQYPSTVDEQTYRLEIDYPDVEGDLNRWLPLVKWLLAIPHYIVLLILAVGLIIAVLIAWVSILITGKYPKPLFDYVVGVLRWASRVFGYAFWLVTDRYPPFSLS